MFSVNTARTSDSDYTKENTSEKQETGIQIKQR